MLNTSALRAMTPSATWLPMTITTICSLREFFKTRSNAKCRGSSSRHRDDQQTAQPHCPKRQRRTTIPAPAGLTTAGADVELPGAQRVGSGLPAQYKFDGEPWSGSEFYDRVKDVWGTAAKKLGNVLDSGAKYDVHTREFAKLAPRI